MTRKKTDIRAPSLTFVVIVHNAQHMIEETLDRLTEAIVAAEWANADIVVVDDGSTDDTYKVVDSYSKSSPVRIVVKTQKNQGRLTASKNGVKWAKGEIVSFIGSRVFMNRDSLIFLKKQLIDHPDRVVWNCHIEVPRDNNPQAQFWHVLTFVAWRRYLRKPRLISYGIEDFDYYPKGTGGFICPRELLLDGYAQLNSVYSDEKYSSDDTTLIRYIATKQKIHMSPKYSADYIARAGLGDFIKHTYGRGTFLLDSYMRPGTRFFLPIVLFFILFLPLLYITLLFPAILALIPFGMVAVFILLVAIGVRPRDALGFCILSPVFGVVYTLGMWRGLYIYMKSKFRRTGDGR